MNAYVYRKEKLPRRAGVTVVSTKFTTPTNTVDEWIEKGVLVAKLLIEYDPPEADDVELGGKQEPKANEADIGGGGAAIPEAETEEDESEEDEAEFFIFTPYHIFCDVLISYVESELLESARETDADLRRKERIADKIAKVLGKKPGKTPTAFSEADVKALIAKNPLGNKFNPDDEVLGSQLDFVKNPAGEEPYTYLAKMTRALYRLTNEFGTYKKYSDFYTENADARKERRLALESWCTGVGVDLLKSHAPEDEESSSSASGTSNFASADAYITYLNGVYESHSEKPKYIKYIQENGIRITNFFTTLTKHQELVAEAAEECDLIASGKNTVHQCIKQTETLLIGLDQELCDIWLGMFINEGGEQDEAQLERDKLFMSVLLHPIASSKLHEDLDVTDDDQAQKSFDATWNSILDSYHTWITPQKLYDVVYKLSLLGKVLPSGFDLHGQGDECYISVENLKKVIASLKDADRGALDPDKIYDHQYLMLATAIEMVVDNSDPTTLTDWVHRLNGKRVLNRDQFYILEGKTGVFEDIATELSNHWYEQEKAVAYFKSPNNQVYGHWAQGFVSFIRGAPHHLVALAAALPPKGMINPNRAKWRLRQLFKQANKHFKAHGTLLKYLFNIPNMFFNDIVIMTKELRKRENDIVPLLENVYKPPKLKAAAKIRASIVPRSPPKGNPADEKSDDDDDSDSDDDSDDDSDGPSSPIPAPPAEFVE